MVKFLQGRIGSIFGKPSENTLNEMHAGNFHALADGFAHVVNREQGGGDDLVTAFRSQNNRRICRQFSERDECR